MTPETLLLHVCCAHCGAYPVQHWRQAGYRVSAYWYNPNVQPYLEHESRLDAVRRLSETLDLPLLTEPGYAFTEHLRAVSGRVASRCEVCYRLRLSQTAAAARRHGFSSFSTTLLISHQQDRGEIAALGEEVAREAGVKFLSDDLSRYYSESRRLTKPLELYRQQYCGCVYSEYERYTGTTLID
jgi:predicted adenine nucleotide alpha hydrolase (AANH) superfamily ATPase